MTIYVEMPDAFDMGTIDTVGIRNIWYRIATPDIAEGN